MRFLTLSFFALALFTGNAITDPQVEPASTSPNEIIREQLENGIDALPHPFPIRECRLRPHNLLLTRKEIIGISNLPSFSGIGHDVLLAFKDGSAISYNTQDLRQRKRHFHKFLLAPAYGDDESCSTNSLESYEFDCMSVTMCPGVLPIRKAIVAEAAEAKVAPEENLVQPNLVRHRPGKTFFAYHRKGDCFPSASYATRGPASRQFCQVFPTTPHPETLLHCPGFAQPSSSSFSFFDNHHGDLYFMLDYDNNDLLVQVGTTLKDCDNPLVRRHFHEKIVSFATCCYFPIVFIGFENGNVGIYAFKSTGSGCNGKLVCISLIPPPCGCDCIAPIPIGIQLCCDFDGFQEAARREVASGNQQVVDNLANTGFHIKTQVTILYKNHERCCKSGKRTFLKSIDFTFFASVSPFHGVDYIVLDKHYHPTIVNDY